MFASKKQNTTVIAEGLKIVGSITADGLVEVRGQVDGEMHCTSLIISRNAFVAGTIAADHITVDGKVEGPINCGEVVLKSQAHVVGDISCQSVIIEKGAFMEGRLVRAQAVNETQPSAASTKQSAQVDAAESESTTRKAELVVEARHLSGDPDLLIDDALAFLAKRGNAQAKAFLNASSDAKGTRKQGHA